jgi:hypothetical protein
MTTIVTASLQGYFMGDELIDVFRFSSNAIDIEADLTGFGPFQMQLYDVATGSKINENTGTGRIFETLPSSEDNLARDYLLAVWSPGIAGEYSLDIDLRVLPENPDSVGDSLSDAQFIDIAEQHTFPDGRISEFASLNLDLGSNQDIDVYRIVANNSVTKVSTRWKDNVWPRSAHLKVEIVDSNGEDIAVLADYGPRDGTLKTRRLDFETVVGESYFVRFSILEGGPLATRVSIR